MLFGKARREKQLQIEEVSKPFGSFIAGCYETPLRHGRQKQPEVALSNLRTGTKRVHIKYCERINAME
jgi:hypothetical protein